MRDIGGLLVEVGCYVTEMHLVTDKYTRDVEAVITTGMDLEGIRNACLSIEDGHVMAETVALEADYTGERSQPEGSNLPVFKTGWEDAPEERMRPC